MENNKPRLIIHMLPQIHIRNLYNLSIAIIISILLLIVVWVQMFFIAFNKFKHQKNKFTQFYIWKSVKCKLLNMQIKVLLLQLQLAFLCLLPCRILGWWGISIFANLIMLFILLIWKYKYFWLFFVTKQNKQNIQLFY